MLLCCDFVADSYDRITCLYKRLRWFRIILFRDVHEALVPSSALATDAVTDLDERQLVTAVKRVPIHHLLF
jgi:hypothetical protein